MIITDTSSDKFAGEKPRYSSLATEAVPNDAPPAYSDSQLPPTPSSPAPSPIAGPSVPRAVNHVSLYKQWGSMNKKFVLDPTLHIPVHFRSSEKNLFLETQTGHLDADITLINSGEAKVEARAMRSGNVWVNLHRQSMDGPRVKLTASTAHGHVCVHLPKNFRGLVVANVPSGFFKRSEGIRSLWRVLSSGASSSSHYDRCDRPSENIHRGFIGEMPKSDSEEEWKQIDEVNIDVKIGSVILLYEDEETWGEKVESFVKGVVGKALSAAGIKKKHGGGDGGPGGDGGGGGE